MRVEGDPFDAVLGEEDLVAVSFEQRFRDGANIRFVVHDQDRFAAAARGGGQILAAEFRGLALCGRGREIDVEAGTVAGLGDHFDQAIVAFGDSKGRREAEAGSFARFLRGEERFKKMLVHFLRDARAVVLDAEHDILPGWNGKAEGEHRVLQGDVAAGELDLPAVGEHVACVDGEIEQDLVDLRRVAVDRPAIVGKIGADGNVARKSLLRHADHVFDQVARLQEHPLGFHAAGERQNLADDFRAAPRR